ncbi:uncharacterized protein G2W53_014636 [Senna tora]|uniref:Uncharacterized protein n=1 Tax=Senna tora TaxID=362788 RepID=A0A834WU73_9FABA|nr:uncharacterized protein G2W53_014636 [Senna tora]
MAIYRMSKQILLLRSPLPNRLSTSAANSASSISDERNSSTLSFWRWRWRGRTEQAGLATVSTPFDGGGELSDGERRPPMQAFSEHSKMSKRNQCTL